MSSVTRKSQASRETRRAEIRNRLLAAVEKFISEGESFTEIPVERLVAEADVSRTTFYVYFADKGDLLRAWFVEIFGSVSHATDVWFSLSPDADRAELRSALDRLVQAYRPHAVLMAAVVDASGYDSTVRELVVSMMHRNVKRLCDHIVAGQENGSVNQDLHPQETAEWLTWMAERGMHQLVSPAGDDDVRIGRLVDAYAAIVWRALYAGARDPRPPRVAANSSPSAT